MDRNRPNLSLPGHRAGHVAAERASALKLRPRTLARSGEEIDANLVIYVYPPSRVHHTATILYVLEDIVYVGM